MKDKEEKTAGQTGYLLRLIRTNKRTLPCILLTALTGAVQPLIPAAMLRLVIQVLEQEGEVLTLCVNIGALTLCTALCMVGKSYLDGILTIDGDFLRYQAMHRILNASMGIPYSGIESRKKREELEKANHFINSGGSNATGICGICHTFAQMASCLLGSAAVPAMLFRVHPALSAVLLLCGGGIFLIQLYLSKKEKQFLDDSLPIESKIYYLSFGKPTQTAAAKDIRIFSLSSWFSPLIDLLIGDRIRLMSRFFRHVSLHQLFILLLALFREGTVMFFLVGGTARGELSAGDFAFYFGLVSAFTLWIDNMASVFIRHRKTCLQCADFRRFTEQPMPCAGDAAVCPEEYRKNCGVEFDSVHFSYTKDEPALENISFSVRPGEKIAVVGANGAGKTTCMKLLCGLYAPDSGHIRINGKEARDIPQKTLFSLFSAVFQDAFRFAGTIAENISLSEETDRERVEQVLRQAGLWETVQTLPAGMDTPLDKELFPDGAALSGGEMQKLFLARALYKDAPVMILDEPTAALDPIAENELYRRFHELTRDKTAFYISHRLSSTRFCNRILFFENGRITEEGTHEELMAKNGGYARMFRMQSYYYQQGGNRE